MTSERRNSMTLDEISSYWRFLRQSSERPNLHKICDSLNTLDIACGAANVLGHHLTHEAWSSIRDDMFDRLLSSFPGYFIITAEGGENPTRASDSWPEGGRVEFYPEKANRRSDVYANDLRRVHPSIVLGLRWCLADGRQHTRVEDFESYRNQPEAEEARLLLENLYHTIEDEAVKSRKIAHRKWWHLFWEANACSDRRMKSELRRQMSDLKTVWGAPPR